MKIHHAFRFPALLFLSLLLFSACQPSAAAAPTVALLPRPEHPNIIFILADDLDAMLGTLDTMPNLKLLLTDQGLTLQDFFVSDAECCPSRATILRGQYVHSHQVYTNKPPEGSFEKFTALDLEASALAAWLQEGGYRTVLLGKYLNGYPGSREPTYVPPGWAEWYGLVHEKQHQYQNYQLVENGKVVTYTDDSQDYLTDVLARKTVDFIQRSASDPAPFFIYLSVYAPHSPAIPAERHAGLFEGLKAPRTPSFNEDGIYDKPKSLRIWKLRDEQIQEIDRLYRLRVQTMQAVDEMLAQVVQALEQSGKLDTTYIVFSSDNGFHMGQHRFQPGKTRAYEEDIRVPFIIRGPGIPAGQTLSGYLTGNVDLAPTFADLAGVSIPDFVEGRSLAPLFFGALPSPGNWRNAFFIEYYLAPEEETGLLPPYQIYDFGTKLRGLAALTPFLQEEGAVLPFYIALRTLRYKFVLHATGEQELYDLLKDPYELENLKKDADPALLQKFEDWARRLLTCAGETCRSIESEQPPLP